MYPRSDTKSNDTRVGVRTCLNSLHHVDALSKLIWTRVQFSASPLDSFQDYLELTRGKPPNVPAHQRVFLVNESSVPSMVEGLNLL